MATYYINMTHGDREVEAENWRVESDFVIFFKKPQAAGQGIPNEYKVFSTKASTVISIELKAGQGA